jgi:hypothetical protein
VAPECYGPAAPAPAWRHVQADARAARPVAAVAGTGCRSVRLSWPGLDGTVSYRGHPSRVRRAVSLQSRGQPVTGGRLESAEATSPREPAQRGGNRAVADGALAGSKKGAAREGRTIVWVDESGFSLLPAVVRSLAPRGHPPTLRFPVTREHLSVISGCCRSRIMRSARQMWCTSSATCCVTCPARCW